MLVSNSRLMCSHSFPVTYLFRTTGQVIGVSLSGALLQAVLTKKLRERITRPDAYEVRHGYAHDEEICLNFHLHDQIIEGIR